MTPAQVHRATILRGVVGSSVHGVSVASTDDRDEMGVALEHPEFVIGLKQWETLVERTQPEGVRSGPGDLDLTIYSLRKFCRLALAGNPSILVLLFVPLDKLVVMTEAGAALQHLAEAFAARRTAGMAYLGYFRAQRERLSGERGGMKVNRPELIEKYGFDTKYAGHVIRLGYQGSEFLTTGRLTLPMRSFERERIINIREGRVKLRDVLAEADGLEADIEALMQRTSPLPVLPDYDRVNQFLFDVYQDAWGVNAMLQQGRQGPKVYEQLNLGLQDVRTMSRTGATEPKEGPA